MSDKPKTKKFPVSLGKDGSPTTRSEFIIPPLCGEPTGTFIGLESGRERKQGAISYIGKQITTDDVLLKLNLLPKDVDAARKKLDYFLTQLQSFRLGNVISIQHDVDGSFILKKEADHPRRKQERKLP
jgi:hypothetical protein